MSDEKKIVKLDEEARTPGKDEGEELVVQLKRPFVFEGTEYDEVDLSGLETLTIQDAVDAQRELMGGENPAANLLIETTTAFSMALAARATGKPIEFFKMMPMGAARQVTAAVRSYLNAETGDAAAITLERPYLFEGKEYTQVDLSGLVDLNAMHMTEAENRMARAGFVILENSFNLMYACIVAGMAAKLPEEFFLGLPLKELLKVKSIVNDADFFE